MRLLCLLCLLSFVSAAHGKTPVYIGFDAEAGHLTSTSDKAIRLGLEQAIAEINAAGGVLDGRPLQLIVKDNRSVPARGIENLKAFAAQPDLVAVFCGKFSPVVLEQIETVHQLGIPLLNPWAAADAIVDNGHAPNYVFRLSLRDSWAMPVMLDHLRARGLRRIGVLLPNTSWGRSNRQALETHLGSGLNVTLMRWYNWGDRSLLEHYQAILDSGAEGLLLVANEMEGAILVREMATLPPEQRLPVASHWGVSGGDFPAMTGPALHQIDFAVVQTYSFLAPPRPSEAARLLHALRENHGIDQISRIPSPVGVAHAYDLAHILARAIDLAGSTDRARVRDALEQVRNYPGLIKQWRQPFSRDNHEALTPGDVFMARYRADGALVPVEQQP
ncbi:MAG: ABC transporter substrate-binding protein [Pseudomonadota bacterium]